MLFAKSLLSSLSPYTSLLWPPPWMVSMRRELLAWYPPCVRQREHRVRGRASQTWHEKLEASPLLLNQKFQCGSLCVPMLPTTTTKFLIILIVTETQNKILSLCPIDPGSRVTKPGVSKPKTKGKYFPILHKCTLHTVQNVDSTDEKKSKSPTESQYPEITTIKILMHGLPWWRSGWESACQCRGHGFEPWSGKIPHAEEQLGPWATTTEPARLEPVLRNKRGRDSERPAHRDEEWPPLAATRESPPTETKTQHSQK